MKSDWLPQSPHNLASPLSYLDGSSQFEKGDIPQPEQTFPRSTSKRLVVVPAMPSKAARPRRQPDRCKRSAKDRQTNVQSCHIDDAARTIAQAIRSARSASSQRPRRRMDCSKESQQEWYLGQHMQHGHLKVHLAGHGVVQTEGDPQHHD